MANNSWVSRKCKRVLSKNKPISNYVKIIHHLREDLTRPAAIVSFPHKICINIEELSLVAIIEEQIFRPDDSTLHIVLMENKFKSCNCSVFFIIIKKFNSMHSCERVIEGQV
jgi:hypothetical protein